MSIWNNPQITFKQFATYLKNEKNKSSLKQIWCEKTKNKVFVSELESHELSNILVLFQKECIESFNSECSVKEDELQDLSHLFSDWIFENKLSGIPMNDEEDYNKHKLMDIFDKNLIFKWISSSILPLKTYINSKTQHDPTQSQKQITAKNKHLVDKHPSLAHLFTQKIVNTKHTKFNDYHNTKHKQNDENHANIHKIRQSRAMLFFNHSDIGYEVKRRCKVYKDTKLTDFLIQVDKGELFGGKIQKMSNKMIEILEPIKGYIQSKYVKEFALDSAQWKFLQHQRSETSTAEQSLTLRIEQEQLLLPPDDDNDDEKAKTVHFTGAYNENEDEKKIEETSLKKESESIVSRVLKIKKTQRTPRDVLDLWCGGFNLHSISVLKECYSSQVTSKQFVNQELNARDPVLQCLKQMFEASDDVGLKPTNIILKDGLVILEFRSFGTRKEESIKNWNTEHDHLLASHPTKHGLPQKVIDGVGIFEVNNGEIQSQRLCWDQDQQWFSDMNVIKMPQSSTLSHFLYKNKLAPVLNLTEQHLESISSSNSNGSEQIMNENHVTLNGGDNNVIYEMNDEMSEILALRGLNISDLKEYHPSNKHYRQNKQKQLAQAIFWIAVGAMFVFIVPKYLGKPKR